MRLRKWLALFVLAPLLLPGAAQALINAQSNDVRILAVGANVERDLSGGQQHSYQIALAMGQFLQAVVEQRGIDVLVIVLAPDGRKVIEVDSPNGTQGPEPIWMIAEVAGDYRLEVRSLEAKAAGRYAVKVEAIRAPTATDQARVAALRAFGEASQLRQQTTGDAMRKAVQKYEQALPLWQSVGDKEKEAETLSSLGFLYHNYLGETLLARDYHERELPLRRVLGQQLGEAIALNNLGHIYSTLGERQKSLEHYQQSLTLHRSAGRRRNEAVVLDHLGQVYSQTGNPQLALDHHWQALAIFRALGEHRHEAVTLINISNVLTRLGEWSKALEYQQQGLAVFRVIKDQLQEAITLTNIAASYSNMGERQQTLKHYQQAMALNRSLGNGRLEAYALSGIGSIHVVFDEFQQAASHFQQALRLLQNAGDRRAEADTLLKLGIVRRLTGEWQQAETSFANALSLSRAVQDVALEAQILDGFALLEQSRGSLASARRYSEQAIELTESLRARAASQQSRAAFLASKQSYYEHYIDLLMRLHREQPGAGNDSAALKMSEQARARSLLELLAEARADIRQGADAALLAEERALRQQLNARAEAQTRLLGGKHTEAQAAAIAKEIAGLVNRLQEVESRIRTASPRYAALTQPQPLSAAEIQNQLLDDDTLLLEYALGEKRSYLWLVSPTSLAAHELPGRVEIEAAARKVYESLTARQPKPGLTEAQQRARVVSAEAEFKTQATALSRMLLGSVASQLGNKRLAVVASGALEYIPFAALPDPMASANYQPLIAAHEVVNLPSASSLAVIRSETAGRRTAEKTVAVLADPVFETNDPRVALARGKKTTGAGDAYAQPAPEAIAANLQRAVRTFDTSAGRAGLTRLPFSREEAEAIATLAPASQVLKATGFRANRATATSEELSRYRIVHFATHGLLNSEHPELSGLVFSLVDETGKPQDGFLRLHEIYNLRLPADLVVLSACQTALGKEFKGEGLVGMTRGFMYAGAERVVASLWQVDDLATSGLMERFYRGMLKDGQRPAAALRSAQLEMMKQRRWASPYFWAAFVLQGEWR